MLKQGLLQSFEDGQVVQVLSCVLDRTDQRRMEERFSGFYNLAVEMMCILDERGFILEINQAWGKKFNISQKKLHSQNILEWVNPKDLEKTKEKMERVLMGERIEGFENRIKLEINHIDGFPGVLCYHLKKT